MSSTVSRATTAALLAVCTCCKHAVIADSLHGPQSCKMPFNHVRNLDARNSVFNHAGRDLRQINIYHIYINIFGSRRPNRIVIDTSDMAQPTLDSLPRASPPVAYPSVVAGLDLDTTTNLIDQTMPILLDLQKSSGTRHYFAPELESLHQTLILTKFTIQRYSNTPLSQNLVNLIAPEVKRCFATLQKLLGGVNGVWLVFGICTVGGLCRRMWCGEWDEDQFPSLRKKLSQSRQMLQEFLIALHSYVFLFLPHFATS
jgi:hypothetical protein